MCFSPGSKVSRSYGIWEDVQCDYISTFSNGSKSPTSYLAKASPTIQLDDALSLPAKQAM